MYPTIQTNKKQGHSPRLAALRLLRAIESLFDRAFGTVNNPWHNLGTLSYFFFWIIAATGLYLYAVFDTSVHGAYRSIQEITAQWYFGGVIRSLHRYASDAFAVTITAHLIREFLRGHYANFRWFSWVSGVPLLWLAFSSGINGYWLVWDQLSQFVAIATAELLDWLPIFGGSMIRNFLTPESVSNRFFSLLVFLHIGLPLLLLAGMWIHILRINRARINPSRKLAWMVLAALIILSLLNPAVSTPPANIAITPTNLPLDWFYLSIYPLLYAWSPAKLWALLGGVTLLLFLIPLLLRTKREPVAVVNLSNCNGCGRCFNDCPYSAVTMQPRTDGAKHAMEAVVNSDLCASCGICAGACPSSTPFRSIKELITGIDMPQQPVDALRKELAAVLQTLSGENKVVVFGCSCAAQVSGLASPGVAVFSLICTGQLPPSFVEFALRNGADGVFITGCHDGACEFRFGNSWTTQRMAGKREPHLRRDNVDLERIRMVAASDTEFGKLAHEVEIFRRHLQSLSSQSRPEPIESADRIIEAGATHG